MIIKDYQLDQYIKSDNSEFIAFLVYGPNEGLIRNNITNIKKLFSQEKKCDEILINCKDLDKDRQLMADKLSSISMFNEKTPLVVIVGSEDKGISVLTQKKCDFLLRIPLKGKTSSLNASVAAAISLFHLTCK